MSWWEILLIVWGGLATVVAIAALWFLADFLKGMSDAFGRM